MRSASAFLTGFHATRPRHVVGQAQLLDWLADAHGAAEADHAGLSSDAREAFAARIRKALRRCACPPDKIGVRGLSVDLAELADAGDTAARMRRYAEIVDAHFEAEYPGGEATPPADLVHVTCTGYVSPSGAQKLVARRGWGDRTRVTHAYHMGCYAALPAVRLADGLLAASPVAERRPAHRVDVVHTELCSLHLDASRHEIEQLVVQSLFADGFIRYSLLPAAAGPGPGLLLVAQHEVILPDSAEDMRWVVGAAGMEMTLSRHVPDKIATALRGFVIELYRRAGLDVAAARDSVFAVHPGGPKIIDRVRDVLELREPQIAASRAVLFEHGNMSSATLPHIWARVSADAAVPPGTLVASLAFGPGLTVCGALFEKRGGGRGR